jgi:hypothetical protein
MQVLENVRRFRLTVGPVAAILAAALVLGAALAIGANGSIFAIRPANSTALVTAGSPHPGMISPHRPLARRAITTGPAPAQCTQPVQFHKRVKAFCFYAVVCTGPGHGPNHIRPSAAANRSAADIFNALQRSGCTS